MWMTTCCVISDVVLAVLLLTHLLPPRIARRTVSGSMGERAVVLHVYGNCDAAGRQTNLHLKRLAASATGVGAAKSAREERDLGSGYKAADLVLAASDPTPTASDEGGGDGLAAVVPAPPLALETEPHYS